MSDPSDLALIIEPTDPTKAHLCDHTVELLNFTDQHCLNLNGQELCLPSAPPRGECGLLHFEEDSGLAVKLTEDTDGTYFRTMSSIYFPRIFVQLPLPNGIAEDRRTDPIPILLVDTSYADQLGRFLKHYNPGVAVAHFDTKHATFDEFEKAFQDRAQATAADLVSPRARHRVLTSRHHTIKSYRAITFDAVPDELSEVRLGQPVFLRSPDLCLETNPDQMAIDFILDPAAEDEAFASEDDLDDPP